MSVKAFDPFLKQVVCFLIVEIESSLCMSDKSPFAGLSFANSFSKYVSYLLTLLIVSLQSRKFNFNEPSLSILSFTDHVFGVVAKKSLPYSRSSRFFSTVIL